MGDALRKLWVKAAAALLDECKMEARSAGNGLSMIGDAARIGAACNQVGIGSGYRGVLPHAKRRNRVREGIAEIRILGGATVARPPTGIDCKLGQIGETPNVRHAGDLAWAQGSKLTEVRNFGPLELQVIPQEGFVTKFVVGVVGDVLGHVAVELLKSSDIERCQGSRKRKVD